MRTARDLESAAAWTGTEATSAAAAGTADARAIGDKLASGGIWAKDEGLCRVDSQVDYSTMLSVLTGKA